MKAMQRVCLFVLFLFASSVHAQTRIDPAGIPGALLVCGDGAVSAAAFERFIELAGGAKATIAVIHVNADKPAALILEGLTASAKKKGAAVPQLLAWKDAKAALAELTGVWVIAPNDRREWQNDVDLLPLRAEHHALLRRSGVVATSGRNPGIIGPGALQLLPIVDHAASEKKKPFYDGVVTFQISKGAAFEIRGRTLSAVGDGATHLVSWLKGNAVRSVKLEGKAKEDLTAWLRATRDRVEGFPPKLPEAPVVDKGTLVIVGGGGSPDGLYKKFVDYAGGPEKANIVIFPTAVDPIVKRDVIGALFKKAGAKKATVLYGTKLAEVESKEFLDTLKEATGLWFDGGRQWRFVDCYENTKALPLMFDVLERGGVIGGTSAGATIQGDYLARGGVFNNFDIRYEGYERGLGFLKGVAIDQHFTQRKRHADMTQLMKIHPQYLGIGIDEATALVVQKSIGEVIGKGKVHFYDTNRKVADGQADHEVLAAGARYDLKARKTVPPN